jgi:hypothetical protein
MVLNHFRSLLVILPLALSALQAVAVPNTIYIISNAETPSLGLPGFTPVGAHRVQQCLPPVSSFLLSGCRSKFLRFW